MLELWSDFGLHRFAMRDTLLPPESDRAPPEKGSAENGRPSPTRVVPSVCCSVCSDAQLMPDPMTCIRFERYAGGLFLALHLT